MRNFTCQCGTTLYFENVQCLSCGRALGFDPNRLELRSLEPHEDNQWRAEDNSLYRKCRNYAEYDVCNWLIDDEHNEWCEACRLNATIPNLNNSNNLALWYSLETAKRRLLYSLFGFNLPVVGRNQDPDRGLAFKFLEDGASGNFGELAHYQEVITGHSYGTITINLAEADPASRELMREQMNESYRTLLGHFRHESGHYYWERLIAHGEWLAPFRQLFGDERINYELALSAHYANGPAPDWAQHFVTPYASTHPWEDWAETWAHYLHMLDTLETAHQYNLVLKGQPSDARRPDGLAFLGYVDFETLCNNWVDLTLALNTLNRSMGQPDAYPFMPSPGAIKKLHFVHGVVAAEHHDCLARHAS